MFGVPGRVKMFVARHTHKQLSQGGSGTLTTEKEGRWGLFTPELGYDGSSSGNSWLHSDCNP